MKKNDINNLLSGLLGEEEKPKPEPAKPAPPPPKKPAASERSRQRVEEISRNVEIETSQNRPAPQKRVEQTIPKREPVPVPEPISHFSDEPSQNPAVRMRDRLDETALPMLDAERKPNQIIPPKPRPEQKKRKKKRPQSAQNAPAAQSTAPVRQSDIPAPHSANPPKRKIPHIVVPDELPPDIPRDTSIADELRRRKQMEDMEQYAEPEHIAEPEQPAQSTREQEVNRKAELIKQRIRLAMEQNESEPEPQPEPQPEPIPAEPEAPQEDSALEIGRKAELIKQRIRLAMEQEAAPLPETQEEAPAEEEPESLEEAIAEEVPEEPKKRKKGGLFKKNKKPARASAPEETVPEENVPEEPVIEEAPAAEVYDIPEEPRQEVPPVIEEIPAAEPEERGEPEIEAVSEIHEEPEQIPEPAPQTAPRLRHLSAVDEPKEKGLFGRFGSKKKQSLTSVPETPSKRRQRSAQIQEKEELSAFFEEPKAPVQAAPEAPKAQKWERSAVQEMPEESRKWNKPHQPELPDAVDVQAEHPVQPKPEPKRETPVIQPKPEPKRETPAVQLKSEPKRETPAVQLKSEPKRETPAVQPKPEPRRETPVTQEKPEPKPESIDIQVETKAAESIHVALPEEQRKKGFAAAIRAALDENVQELADEKAEPIPEQNEIDVALGKSKYFRRRTYFMAGIICSVFALVGIAACVMQAVKLVRGFTGSSALRTELTDVLYPIAVVDLPDFEQPSDAAPDTLMSAAMIDLLMYGDLSGYPKSFDMYTIPAEDVLSRAEEMFGMKPENACVTLYSAGEMFYYDETSGCYNVPASPVIFSYAPDIAEIRRADDIYTITVNYRSDTAQWQQRSENFDALEEKTMEITVQQNGEHYQIVRIRNISEHAEGV